MYLRSSSKWKEFLLAGASQPAVLLVEVTLDDAEDNLFSKKTKKMIRRALDAGTWLTSPHVQGTGGIKPGEFSSMSEEMKERVVDLYTYHFKGQLLGDEDRQTTGIVPRDLRPEQRALALMWLVRLARQDDIVAQFLLTGYPGRPARASFSAIREDLEMFFHYKRFMAEADLNKIKGLEELEQVVLDARGPIRDYQEGRAYTDADAEGAQEVFRDDEEWKILAIHNKGAACELGKGTDWCTAAPGLDFFSTYYKPEDPLFYFEDRDPSVAFPRNRPEDDVATGDAPRYQFHYGSEQFHDEADREVEPEMLRLLHDALMQTEAPSKYPIVRKFERKLVLGGRDTTPEILEKMSTEEGITYLELINIAGHHNVGPETLQKLVKVRNPTEDYIGGVGKNDYGPGLKEQIARSKSATPEVLDGLLEDAEGAYHTMIEDSMRSIQASHEKWKKEGPTPPTYRGGPEGPDLDEEWVTRAKSMRLLKIQDFFKPVFMRAIANENISNERLKIMLDNDPFQTPSWWRSSAPRAMRQVPLTAMIKEKLAARRAGEELGYVDIRGRMIRRKNPRTAAKLPPLQEGGIIQRWQKIIK
jgi:hypothetical protein